LSEKVVKSGKATHDWGISQPSKKGKTGHEFLEKIGKSERKGTKKKGLLGSKKTEEGQVSWQGGGVKGR